MSGGSVGNLHVALALALGVQPSETDAQLIDRVYALTGRARPARRPRSLSAGQAVLELEQDR